MTPPTSFYTLCDFDPAVDEEDTDEFHDYEADDYDRYYEYGETNNPFLMDEETREWDR